MADFFLLVERFPDFQILLKSSKGLLATFHKIGPCASGELKVFLTVLKAFGEFKISTEAAENLLNHGYPSQK